LKGDDIPLVSRIVAVADVFDALTHRRPYKEPWPVKDALIEIENHQGRQFDPQVVSALRQVVEEIFDLKSDGTPNAANPAPSEPAS
jgi:HD-GYP domain-containing protein (c-di-GMP phosphodiesterase class II)